MRTDFAIPTIKDQDKPNLDAFKESAISQQYLSITLQQTNNSLRDIFLSSLTEKQRDYPSRKRLDKMITLLENKLATLQAKEKKLAADKYQKNLKGNIKADITKIKNMISYLEPKNRPLENIDCLSSSFVAMLNTIKDDKVSADFFHDHLLYNRVLPVNDLDALCTLLTSTLQVRQYLGHPDTKKITMEDFINCLHLLCMILPPQISHTYLAKLNIDTTFIQKYWQYLYRQNMSVYFAIERSKRRLKETNKKFENEQARNRYLA